MMPPSVRIGRLRLVTVGHLSLCMSDTDLSEKGEHKHGYCDV